MTGQRQMGLMYLVVLKVIFLGMGDPKVLVLDTGDGGEKQGSVGESGCIEEMEDIVEASEEMDMAEEQPEEFTALLLYN